MATVHRPFHEFDTLPYSLSTNQLHIVRNVSHRSGPSFLPAPRSRSRGVSSVVVRDESLSEVLDINLPAFDYVFLRLRFNTEYTTTRHHL